LFYFVAFNFQETPVLQQLPERLQDNYLNTTCGGPPSTLAGTLSPSRIRIRSVPVFSFAVGWSSH